jgi:DNA-binding IclR family transcriptional regulator
MPRAPRSPAKPPKRLTPAVVDAIAILNHLQAHPPVRLSLTEIVRALGISAGTGHAILQTLVHYHYVIQDPLDKTYTLGPALIGLGAAAAGDVRFAETFRSALSQLAARTGLSACAAKLLPNAHVATVVQSESVGALQLSAAVGATFPLTPPFGAVFLAWASPDEVERWFAVAAAGGFGPASAAERDDYLTDLQRVRREGYAWTIRVAAGSESGLAELRTWLVRAAAVGIDHRSEAGRAGYVAEIRRLGELLPEHRPNQGLVLATPIVSISAPIFDFQGRVQVCIFVFALSSEIPPERVGRIGEEVRAAAHTLTAATGGREPDTYPRSAERTSRTEAASPSEVFAPG